MLFDPETGRLWTLLELLVLEETPNSRRTFFPGRITTSRRHSSHVVGPINLGLPADPCRSKQLGIRLRLVQRTRPVQNTSLDYLVLAKGRALAIQSASTFGTEVTGDAVAAICCLCICLCAARAKALAGDDEVDAMTSTAYLLAISAMAECYRDGDLADIQTFTAAVYCDVVEKILAQRFRRLKLARACRGFYTFHGRLSRILNLSISAKTAS